MSNHFNKSVNYNSLNDPASRNVEGRRHSGFCVPSILIEDWSEVNFEETLGSSSSRGSPTALKNHTMLKRIRKMSKQKASGKDQEELAKKDKTRDMKEKKEMTTLLSERDSLQEEVKKLREQLQNENIRYAELKSLKTQQVCALTFKLAKAVRDKERAIEESENLKQELEEKRSTREEHEESGDLDNRPETPLESKQLENSTKENDGDKSQLPLEKMSCFVITGEPVHKERFQEGVQEEMKQELVENSGGGGEPTNAAEEALNGDENSDCSSDTLSLSQCSSKSDDQNAKKKVMIEFRRIQKELRDVKKNMAMVQGLNERLSRDLRSLVDKKNSHPLARSQSLRMRRNGSSDLSNDSVDGKQDSIFVFPATESTDKAQVKTTHDVSTETTSYLLDQIDGSDKKSDERIECSNQESLEITQNDALPVELEPIPVAQSQDDDQERQANVMEVRKQLEKAMKELEELRADNREMKEKINKIASSTDHDFLRKTTQFTGALLKEMRERELKIERNIPKTMPKVEQPPLSVLGTRLNEISKTVDDMTKSDPTPPPLESVCVTSSVDSALMTEPTPRPQSAGLPTTHSLLGPIPRPQSAGLPTTHSLLGQVIAKPRPLNKQKKRRFMTGKLGEPSLGNRNFGRLTSESGLQSSVEPLAKDWRSTEDVSPRSSFSRSLGFKDYIQRHIVLSSNAIAKIRDLTPEELNGRIIY